MKKLLLLICFGFISFLSFGFVNADDVDLRVTDVNYDNYDKQLDISIYNDGYSTIYRDFTIRVVINNTERYYTVPNDIYSRSTIVFSVNVSDFNLYTNTNYDVSVNVDYNNDIAENNENNNYYSEYLYVSNNGYYDLQVYDVSYDSYDKQLDIKIYNRGTKDLYDDFKVRVSINNQDRYYTFTDYIPSNSYKIFSVNISDFSLESYKTYSVYINLDSNSEISEDNENNNTYSTSLYFSDIGSSGSTYSYGNIDLTISKIEYNSSINQIIVYWQNNTKYSQNNVTFKIRLEVGGRSYEQYILNGQTLMIEDSGSVGFSLLDNFSGQQYLVKAWIDYSNNVGESNESNNYREEYVYISNYNYTSSTSSKSDLYIREVSKESGIFGKSTIGVCNGNSTDSTRNFYVDFKIYDKTLGRYVYDNRLYLAESNVNYSQCYVGDIDKILKDYIKAGNNYTIRLYADSNNNISESDERNNEFVLDYYTLLDYKKDSINQKLATYYKNLAKKYVSKDKQIKVLTSLNSQVGQKIYNQMKKGIKYEVLHLVKDSITLQISKIKNNEVVDNDADEIDSFLDSLK